MMPCLVALAVDGQRLVPQGLADEARNHHAVTPGLARADGVEKPTDNHRQLLVPEIRQRKKLVHGFGRSIAPACDCG
jgi:hypothetical protein